MMTWYRAVCDHHREFCDVMVSNPNATARHLGGFSHDIQSWLQSHHTCALRLVHHDDELGRISDEGYRNISLTFVEDHDWDGDI